MLSTVISDFPSITVTKTSPVLVCVGISTPLSADIIFIAVGTPTKHLGIGAGKAALIDYVEQAARTIGKYAKHSTIVVEKSTVPVGVSRTIKTVLNASKEGMLKFHIISNPEFLAEGTAINDLHNPDRILIGHELTEDGKKAQTQCMREQRKKKTIYTTEHAFPFVKCRLRCLLACAVFVILVQVRGPEQFSV